MSRKSNLAKSQEPAVIDCWKTIGVQGDGSCKELLVHIHCRNCPVYASAASRMLDRERSAAAVDDATRLFATEKTRDRQADQSAFLFRVGGEWLALPTAVLDEVADLRTIHSLPHRRSGVVLGLVNVRGELLVCVSLAQLLGIEPVVEGQATRTLRIVHRRLLVIRNESGRLAFPADEVHGAQRFDEHKLKPVPATVAKAGACYTRAMLAWREHAVGLLDDELLFHSLNRSLA
ncbi:MAG: chemotaxis protein CheW [Arenimonas sp.]|jgi:chemotaxis-related protein WspD